MRIRLLLLLILAASVPTVSVSSQVVQFQLYPPVGLGFSAGTVVPVTQGVPVYTLGDQLWAISYQGPTIVDLLNASGKSVMSLPLLPMQPALLRTFGNTDLGGAWALNFSGSNISGPPWFLVRVELVNPTVVLPRLTADRLAPTGVLSMDFRVDLGDAYDASSCLVGQRSLGTVQIPIPGNLGSGQLLLTRDGNTTTVQPNGSIDSTFTFWFELHADRSYSQGLNTLVTRDTEEAASVPLPFSPGPSNESSAGLVPSMAVRLGRATIRAFFEGPSGLSVYQTSVLIPDARTWEWLPGCTTSVDQVSSNFTASASLTLPPGAWPKEMYFMYKESGAEAYSKVPLAVFPSVIDLVASPWKVPFTDSGLSITPMTSNVTAAVGNSTVFLISNNYPLQVGLQMPGSPGAQDLSVAQPFTENTFSLQAGKVTVDSLLDGRAVSDSSVSLRLGNQTIASGKGSPTFYVPEGNYAVVGTYGATTRDGNVAAVDGNQTTITLEFGTPGSQVDYWLGVSAVIGAIASVTLWVSLIRNLRRQRVSEGTSLGDTSEVGKQPREPSQMELSRMKRAKKKKGGEGRTAGAQVEQMLPFTPNNLQSYPL
jgi:hypothetical protein